MDRTEYVSCNTCKHKRLIVAGGKDRFWQCIKTGLIFGKRDLVSPMKCSDYEPDILTSLSDKEATLYNFLLDIDGPLVVESIPPSFRGALGKLKKLGLIRIYSSSIKIKVKDPNSILNDRIYYKKTKVVEVIGKEV